MSIRTGQGDVKVGCWRSKGVDCANPLVTANALDARLLCMWDVLHLHGDDCAGSEAWLHMSKQR